MTEALKQITFTVDITTLHADYQGVVFFGNYAKFVGEGVEAAKKANMLPDFAISELQIKYRKPLLNNTKAKIELNFPTYTNQSEIEVSFSIYDDTGALASSGYLKLNKDQVMLKGETQDEKIRHGFKDPNTYVIAVDDTSSPYLAITAKKEQGHNYAAFFSILKYVTQTSAKFKKDKQLDCWFMVAQLDARFNTAVPLELQHNEINVEMEARRIPGKTKPIDFYYRLTTDKGKTIVAEVHMIELIVDPKQMKSIDIPKEVQEKIFENRFSSLASLVRRVNDRFEEFKKLKRFKQ